MSGHCAKVTIATVLAHLPSLSTCYVSLSLADEIITDVFLLIIIVRNGTKQPFGENYLGGDDGGLLVHKSYL